MKELKFTWDKPMNKDEEKTMQDFILYLYNGYSKFGHDKYAAHIFYIAVRDVTRIIGGHKNLKISKEALKILGKCNNFKDVYKAQKANPGRTVKEHKIPAKKFWDEFKEYKKDGKDFTVNDAKRWLDEAVIAIITKEEDKAITSKGWMEDRPKNAYELLNIELEDIK